METTYGALIRRGRRSRQWTQAQLSQRVRVSTGTVSRWENEVTRPNLDQMAELSALLGIQLDALIESGGVRISPPPSSALFGPLVELLAGIPIREQRALYDWLAQAQERSAPR